MRVTRVLALSEAKLSYNENNKNNEYAGYLLASSKGEDISIWSSI